MRDGTTDGMTTTVSNSKIASEGASDEKGNNASISLSPAHAETMNDCERERERQQAGRAFPLRVTQGCCPVPRPKVARVLLFYSCVLTPPGPVWPSAFAIQKQLPLFATSYRRNCAALDCARHNQCRRRHATPCPGYLPFK